MTSTVVVASRVPPRLDQSADVFAYFKFLDELSTYRALHGVVPLRACVSGELLAELRVRFAHEKVKVVEEVEDDDVEEEEASEDLKKSSSFEDASDETLLDIIRSRYVPQSVMASHALLKSCRIDGQGHDKFKLIRFAQRFFQVLTLCEAKLPTKSEIIKIFLRNIAPKELLYCCTF